MHLQCNHAHVKIAVTQWACIHAIRSPPLNQKTA